MYMRGMGRYRGMRGRRGLGQLNCPGDPGCPGYLTPGLNQLITQPDQNQMIATPLTPEQIAALSAANQAFFGSQQGLGPQTPGAPGTQLAKYMPWIVGGLSVVVILGSVGGGRRR